MQDLIHAVAYATACKSTLKRKYAAILVYRGKIISTGFNQHRRSNCVRVTEDYLHGIHAEHDCVMNCKTPRLIPYSTIYIFCIRNGILQPVDPCESCKRLLTKVGCKIYKNHAS